MSRSMKRPLIVLLAAVLPVAFSGCAQMRGDGEAGGKPSFFVTSTGSGKGADLGGLDGADRHCQALASAAGLEGSGTWRAYLSTQGKDGAPTVNARDRIGKGPWHNVKGQLIARDVQHLHSNNNLTKLTALDEKGQPVAGRGDKPNRHDILTGTRPDGTAFSSGDPDMTCGNWTRSGSEGAVVVGHHDRMGPTSDPWATSWNSSHQSRGGCSQEALRGTGGDGLLYCMRE